MSITGLESLQQLKNKSLTPEPTGTLTSSGLAAWLCRAFCRSSTCCCSSLIRSRFSLKHSSIKRKVNMQQEHICKKISGHRFSQPVLSVQLAASLIRFLQLDLQISDLLLLVILLLHPQHLIVMLQLHELFPASHTKPEHTYREGCNSCGSWQQ